MMQLIPFFASTEEAAENAEHAVENTSLFGALGIDWRMLLLQIIAFIVLLWVLGKFVYPHLLKAIDKRQEALEAGLNASKAAQEQAKEAEQRVAEELAEARARADDILAASHKEAAALIAEAEEKAARRAETIIEDAKADMSSQLERARQALKTETRQLVAEATEQILGEKIDATKDVQLVDRAIKNAQKQA